MAALAEVSQGLEAVSDAPLHSVYAQLVGGDTQLGGPFLKGEVGAHITQGLSVFGNAGYEREEGWGALAGVRWEF